MKMHLEFQFQFPSGEVPRWAYLVERWYQLDAEAYGLCQFFWENRQRLGPHPQLIFLASPCGSWPTDRAFAQNPSPAKFVHTLPNVRASSLCQVMEWHGPIHTVQMGKESFSVAEREAERVDDAPVWILGNFPGNRVRAIVFAPDQN